MPFSASAPLEPRLIAAAGAAVIAGLLFLLYVNRRRGYVLVWVTGWVLLGSALLALEDGMFSDAPLTRLVLHHALTVTAALAFAVGASMFGGTFQWSRRHTVGAVLLAFVVGAAAPWIGVHGTTIPGSLAAATAFAAASFRCFHIAYRQEMSGAGLAGAGFALASLTSVWAIMAPASPDTALRLIASIVVGYAVVALGMHLLIFEDTTHELRLSNRRLEAAREELRGLALTDPLTSAYNRRFFDEIIARELERHKRAGEPLSVVFVDVDRFKTVNDVHGHAVGDALLRDVAEFFKGKLRETDYIFRWGGDEFLIIMSCPGGDAARRMQALEHEYETAPLLTSLGGGAGLSIGCAEAPPGTSDIETVIAEADREMYRTKRGVRT